MNLGVDEQTADEYACRMEHDVCGQSFEAIKAHKQKYSLAVHVGCS